MELAISKLTARRVIYYFEGYVKGERPKGLKFVFYNYDLKITIKPSVFEWDGDTFRMMLHVEQANENNPISSGDYYPIAVDAKGKQYPLQVAKSIIEEREQAEWKNDVVVNKGKGHHVICKWIRMNFLFMLIPCSRNRVKIIFAENVGNYIMECAMI